MLVTPYLPHRRVGHGGGTAVREMARHLARRHDLLLAALVRPGEAPLTRDVAADLRCRLLPIPFLDAGAGGIGRIRLVCRRAGALLRTATGPFPYYVEKYADGGVAAALIRAAEDFGPDVIQLEYLQSALWTRDLNRWRARRRSAGTTGPALIASTHELGSVPRERKAERSDNPIAAFLLRHQAAAWRRLQRRATAWADLNLCVTDDDRLRLEADGGRACRTVPLGMDTDAMRPVREPTDPPRCLFVGSFGHGPNRAAAQSLIDTVWPQVSRWFPEARLDIVGPGSDDFCASVRDLPASIRGHGFVDSLTDFYRRSRLFLAPLPEGGGIKIKVLEALAYGLPLVTTPIGAEGILTPEDDAAWIAPPDDTFGAAVRDALSNPEECQRRADRGRRIMEERFSWRAIVDRLDALYEEALAASSQHGG